MTTTELVPVLSAMPVGPIAIPAMVSCAGVPVPGHPMSSLTDRSLAARGNHLVGPADNITGPHQNVFNMAKLSAVTEHGMNIQQSC